MMPELWGKRLRLRARFHVVTDPTAAADYGSAEMAACLLRWGWPGVGCTHTAFPSPPPPPPGLAQPLRRGAGCC